MSKKIVNVVGKGNQIKHKHCETMQCLPITMSRIDPVDIASANKGSVSKRH